MGHKASEGPQQTSGDATDEAIMCHNGWDLKGIVFAKIRKFFKEMLSISYFICIFAADL
jgi:hypothetical protein